jgi:hypothetical protein
MEGRPLRVRRAAAQLLSGQGGASAPEIVARLLAVQAQDLRSARLALRARSDTLTAADVDRALSVDRSLVVGWLARGTLHLARREDYPWLLALTAPRALATSRRRLAEEGVSADEAERAVALVERALVAEGPVTRPELAERIAFRGIRTEGQATPHLVKLAVLRGVALLGPLRAGKQAFVSPRDWLGATPPFELSGAGRDAALAELARRYLRGHGPATSADLSAWAGLALRDARAGLRSIADELVELDRGLVDLAARDPSAARLPPRLLPAFDPYLLGWKHRAFAVPAEHARRVHPGGGMLRAVATVDGLAAGTWSARRRGDRLAVDLELFSPLGWDVAALLETEAADVARFEGLALAGSETGSQ